VVKRVSIIDFVHFAICQAVKAVRCLSPQLGCACKACAYVAQLLSKTNRYVPLVRGQFSEGNMGVG
jgi:hypothetical protein